MYSFICRNCGIGFTAGVNKRTFCSKPCQRTFGHTEETKEKMRKPKNFADGISPLKGRSRPQEVIEKISASKMGHILTDEMKSRISEGRRGITPKYKNPELRLKRISESLTGHKYPLEKAEEHSKQMKAWWSIPENKARMCKIRQETWADEDFKVAQIEKMNSAARIGPTRPELLVKDVIDDLGLYFKYVGDGSFWIRGKNPDFINVPDKKIIEVFGCYYHGCESCGIPNSLENDLMSRMEHYERYGYEMLVLWEHEMASTDLLIGKITKYANLA